MQHAGAFEICEHKTSTQFMLVFVLALLHKALVFGLAQLDAGICLDCRPTANDILSEAIAR